MDKNDRLKALVEFQRAEEEAKKYCVDSDWFVVTQDHDNPNFYTANINGKETRLSEKEVAKYRRYNKVIKVIHREEPLKRIRV